MEAALTTAFKKNYGKSNSKVLINRDTGSIKVYSYITVISDDLEGVDEEGTGEDVLSTESESMGDTTQPVTPPANEPMGEANIDPDLLSENGL